jgi:hypothetical protein
MPRKKWKNIFRFDCRRINYVLAIVKH